MQTHHQRRDLLIHGYVDPRTPLEAMFGCDNGGGGVMTVVIVLELVALLVV